MAPKPKVGGSKGKPPPKVKDEEQFERFIETARMHDLEDDPDLFDAVFKNLIPSKLSRSRPPKK
jgi:hypothetical protein